MGERQFVPVNVCAVFEVQWFECAIQDDPEDGHDLRQRVDRWKFNGA